MLFGVSSLQKPFYSCDDVYHAETEGNSEYEKLTHRPAYRPLCCGHLCQPSGLAPPPCAPSEDSFSSQLSGAVPPHIHTPPKCAQAPKCQQSVGRPGSNSEFRSHSPSPRELYLSAPTSANTVHMLTVLPARSLQAPALNSISAAGGQTGYVHSSPTKSPNRSLTHKRDGAITTSKCHPDGAQDRQVESSPAGLRIDIRNASEAPEGKQRVQTRGRSSLASLWMMREEMIPEGRSIPQSLINLSAGLNRYPSRGPLVPGSWWGKSGNCSYPREP